VFFSQATVYGRAERGNKCFCVPEEEEMIYG